MHHATIRTRQRTFLATLLGVSQSFGLEPYSVKTPRTTLFATSRMEALDLLTAALDRRERPVIALPTVTLYLAPIDKAAHQTPIPVTCQWSDDEDGAEPGDVVIDYPESLADLVNQAYDVYARNAQ
jgi:hypothetical protein